MELNSEPEFGNAYESFLTGRLGSKKDEDKPDNYRRILYWDGYNWTDKPTVNSRWKKLKGK